LHSGGWNFKLETWNYSTAGGAAMLGVAGLGLLLLAPAAPFPVPRLTAVPPNADRTEALALAGLIYNLASQVARDYVRPVEVQELVEGAARGLYEEAGLPLPDDVRRAIRRSTNSTALVEALADARVALGNHPALTGYRAVFAAATGFRHATDPQCMPVSPRMSSFASVDLDFRIGLELDGATGTRWALYQVETGRLASVPGFGTPVHRDAPPPASFPWRVRRVIPGSPAQQAGVRPGDVITHLNGSEVTAETAGKLFAEFAYPPAGFDPMTGQPALVRRTLTLRRDGAAGPVKVTVDTLPYRPESVFGVIRVNSSKWDCMLDREHKIGYVRVGAIEEGADTRLEEMLTDLKQQGCRGLILDLRWCPGGFVAPGTAIAGMFLREGAVIAQMRYRDPSRGGRPNEVAPPGGTKFTDLPLVVLVGSETAGGGELIAAALQDNGRAVVIGQRTVGRAYISNINDYGIGGLRYKVTVGASLRPNGKSRQKLPDSQPTGEWGVRPDPGLEVPVTADLSAELGRWADLHALRPASSREALPFDDPVKDPHRLAALAYLRKKLGKP
jgi:C-terminal processing protease CtpA/Prc